MILLYKEQNQTEIAGYHENVIDRSEQAMIGTWGGRGQNDENRFLTTITTFLQCNTNFKSILCTNYRGTYVYCKWNKNKI